MKGKVTVTTKKEEMPPLEILAEQIEALADAGRKLTQSRLKEDTVIHLVSRASGVNHRDTTAVLKALPNLAKKYLK